MASLLTVISTFLQIPSSWLHFPEILTLVIVPFLVLMWFFKILVYEQFKLFKNEGVCWGFGVLFSLIITFVVKLGMVGMFIGLVGIVWFKVNNIFLRIILILILTGILLNLSFIIKLITGFVY